jgi:hypothetical protein
VPGGAIPSGLKRCTTRSAAGASSAGRGRCLESDVSSGSWKPRTSTIWLPSTLTTARRGCRAERFCTAVNEEGRVAHHLWMIKPFMGLDPDECDHEENWWDWEEGQDHERRLH